MATKAECKKCRKRKSCPIIIAIEDECIQADEKLRKLCIEYERQNENR